MTNVHYFFDKNTYFFWQNHILYDNSSQLFYNFSYDNSTLQFYKKTWKVSKISRLFYEIKYQWFVIVIFTHASKIYPSNFCEQKRQFGRHTSPAYKLWETEDRGHTSPADKLYFICWETGDACLNVLCGQILGDRRCKSLNNLAG